MNMAAHGRPITRLAKLCLNKTQDYKVEMFDGNARHHVCRNPNTAYQHKHFTVKQGGGGVVIWATGPVDPCS